MTKSSVLNVAIPPVADRRRMLENDALPINIGALLDEAANDVPDRTALNFFESGETLTFSDLRRQVHDVAHALTTVGISKGAHVAVMLPNIAPMALTWLAIGCIGAVMVPVNVAYRARELAYVVNDSEAQYLVLHESCRARLDQCYADGTISILPARVVIVGGVNPAPYRCWEEIVDRRESPFTPATAPEHDDLLNIQYTSGTTGFPKGCMLTQRYWLNAGKVNAFRDGRRYERILASTPFFYMDPQWLLLMALFQRATLFVAAKQSASRFMGWVRTHRINFCLFPLLAFKQPETPQDRDNDIVRANVYGVPKHLHAAIEKRFEFVAREAFGMTELGPTMFMPIEAADMVGSGSCGIPCPFRECKIVDADGNPTAVGEIGELVVRGAGIFKGYYRKPEANAEAFFGEWFRTGDLFKSDENGYFYIVGRRKDMIRRSSENIAAREVEAVLAGFPGVLEAAVVGVPDETRGEEVKAYIVFDNGSVPQDQSTLNDMIAHCQRNLAAFKVPRFFEFRANLPKTPSLKIAKQILVSERSNLRAGSYDRLENCWLSTER